MEKNENSENFIPLMEFIYNNSFHSSIGTAPFEALFGSKCKNSLYWYESRDNGVLRPEIIEDTTDKIKMNQEKMQASKRRYESYHDMRSKKLSFQVENHVFLSLSLTKEVSRMLTASLLYHMNYWKRLEL